MRIGPCFLCLDVVLAQNSSAFGHISEKDLNTIRPKDRSHLQRKPKASDIPDTIAQSQRGLLLIIQKHQYSRTDMWRIIDQRLHSDIPFNIRSRGDVAIIQWLAGLRGTDFRGIDGFWGPRTESALRDLLKREKVEGFAFPSTSIPSVSIEAVRKLASSPKDRWERIRDRGDVLLLANIHKYSKLPWIKFLYEYDIYQLSGFPMLLLLL